MGQGGSPRLAFSVAPLRRPAWAEGARGITVQWFVGTITNKLDAKGRVSVPADFRDYLKSQGNNGFFCVKSIARERALTAFGNEEMMRQKEALKSLNPLRSKDHAPIAHSIFGQTRQFNFDDTGRVVLADDLIAFLGLTDQVCFVGLGDVFEIWNPRDVPDVEAQRLGVAHDDFEAGGGA